MKIKIFIFCFIFIFCLYPLWNYANSEYREVYTSRGKAVIGLDREEVLEKFGLPTSVSDDLWYYSMPEKFFVYFSHPFSVHLYPKFSETVVDTPLELKAFIYLSNFKIKDITSEVELLINEPQNFALEKPGIIIPKKAGKYQIIGKYQKIFSNPIYFTVKEPREKVKEEEEKLLSIDTLPYKPKTTPGTRLNFVALGTSLDTSKNKYFIRDISEHAMWFVQQEKNIKKAKDSEIFFPSIGKFKVFCKYKDLESFPQEVEIQNAPLPLKQTLKHISLLPEFIITPVDNTINLKAFGTYYNNKVEEITASVKWEIKDKKILEIAEKGSFISKSIGITEVIAGLDNLESVPAKIIIIGKRKSALDSIELYKPRAKAPRSKNLIRDIKKNLEKLSKNILGAKKKLRLIKIIPEYLRIPLGKEGRFVALGIYSDDSEEDLTHLGDWISLDEKVATISKGKISTHSIGNTNIYVRFQEIKSRSATLIVEESTLISIILTPANSKISMRDTLNLKAEGYFIDSSRKDITSLVNWNITSPRTIKIEKGKVRPVRFGQTKVYAEYLGIKSLPANIKVIITMDYIIGMVFKGISFLILGMIMASFVLYLLIEKKKKELISLYKNPREFIVGLYENVKKILTIFGLRHEKYFAPLFYAELIEKRYAVKNSVFLKFTVKFEEAKYSQHILESSDATFALNDYNNFLNILVSNYNKFSLLFRYCLLLLHTRPLFINKS